MKRLKEIRKKRGLTGEMLADKAGTSKSHISDIENGKKNPSAALMRRFARALDVSVFDLIDDQDMTEAMLSHMDIMRALSEEDRRAVARHAAGLLEKDELPSQ